MRKRRSEDDYQGSLARKKRSYVGRNAISWKRNFDDKSRTKSYASAKGEFWKTRSNVAMTRNDRRIAEMDKGRMYTAGCASCRRDRSEADLVLDMFHRKSIEDLVGDASDETGSQCTYFQAKD